MNNTSLMRPVVIALLSLLYPSFANSQWSAGPGNLFLSSSGTVNVGTSTVANQSLLQVRGLDLGMGIPSTEFTAFGLPSQSTFRTITPGGTQNYWSLFKGAASEVGQLFSTGGTSFQNVHFNVGATRGHLRFWATSENSPTSTTPSTLSLLRVQLNRTQTSTINAFPGINTSGFFGISDAPGFFDVPSVNGAFSRLHLAEGGNPQQIGYRPWQRNGITFTGNMDQSYVGQKFGASDESDLVFQWSDNPGTSITDRVRFLFTYGYNGDPTGAGSMNGLEALRMYPVSGSEVNVGIGDFYVAGNDPTERLDVGNGRLRIRDLPASPVRNDLDQVMVVDNTGVVHWRDALSFGAADCEWVYGNGNSNLHTAFIGNGAGCPNETNNVLIGYDQNTTATAKLAIGNGNFQQGLSIISGGAGAISEGAMIMTLGGTNTTNGLNLLVGSTATDVNGVLAQVTGNGTNCTGADLTVTGGNAITRGMATTVTGNGAQVRGVFSSATGTLAGNKVVGGEFLATGGQSFNTGLEVFATSTGNAGCALQGAGIPVNQTLDNCSNAGIRVVVSGAATRSRGVFASTSGGSFTAYAGRFESADATTATSTGVVGSSYNGALENFGVHGKGSSVTAVSNIGVRGDADVASNGTNIGVWGQASGASNANNNWAFWGVGSGMASGGTWQGSDIRLKKNIKQLEGSLEKLLGLAPKSYEFDLKARPDFGLPEGEQIGLIAQELERVFPMLVRDARQPDMSDGEGNLLRKGFDFKAVNYVGLIPVLIGAVQEQQAIIDSKQAQIDALNDRLVIVEEKLGLAPTTGALGGSQTLRISPNPFSDRTSITYTVHCACRVQLQVTGTDGKPVATLVNENKEEGTYTYDWNTSDIAAGSYICTLLVDGVPAVKQAVKVAR